MREQASAITDCGVALALIVNSFGGDAASCFAVFAVGVTYGGLWIAHA